MDDPRGPNKKSLCRELSLNVDVRPETFSEVVTSLSDSELSRLFSLFWKDSKARFCYLHHINFSNFSRWSNGRRDDANARGKVIQYLMTLYRQVDNPKDKELTADSPSNHYHYVRDWNRVMVDAYKHPQKKLIVFLDGDQAIEEIRRLSWLFDGISETNILVLLFSGAGTHIPSFCKDTPYYKWIRAPNHLSQATDLVISMAAKELHNYETTNYPDLRSKFIIVSRDYFAQTLTDILNACKRETIYVDNSSVDLALLILFYLQIYDIPPLISPLANKVYQLIEQRIHCLSKGIEVTDQELAAKIQELQISDSSVAFSRITPKAIKLLDELIIRHFGQDDKWSNYQKEYNLYHLSQIPELNRLKQLLKDKKMLFLGYVGSEIPFPETLTGILKFRKWKEALTNPLVQEFLDCEVVANGQGDYIQFRPFNGEINMSVSLRNCYLSNWKGTEIEFCKLYNCNKGNFIAFIKGRKDSPESCFAIRKWIQDNNIKL